MDHLNISINLIIAAILTISPHFFETSGMTKEELVKTYAQAKVEADRIVQTGDMSSLMGIEQAGRELEALSPLIAKVSQKLVAEGVIPALDVSQDQVMRTEDLLNKRHSP